MAIIYAIITVLAWGSWLIPSQTINFSNNHVRTFYVAVANLVLAYFVYVGRGSQGLTLETAWLPMVGGLIWAVSGYCAFTAINKIGLTRAVGIWTPLNIIVGMIWGVLLFDEFVGVDFRTLLLLILSLVMMIAGILIIIFARGAGSQHQTQASFTGGLLAAIGAGILWGTYFIPINISQQSMWEAAFPLAIGIFLGATALMLITRGNPKLPRWRDYALACSSGLIWGIGNYGMLLMTETIGTGPGFAIAQLGLIVNVAFGIFLYKDPKPGTRAARVTFFGVILALVGGIILGSL